MKVYIRGTAIDRQKAITRIQSLSDNIEDSIIKLCIFEDNTRDYQHQIDELATWFDTINKVVLKSSKSKFSYDEYDELVFGGFGTSYSDCKLALLAWKANNQKSKKYSDVDITKSDVNQLFAVVSQLREQFNELFASKNSVTRHSILDMLAEIFDT